LSSLTTNTLRLYRYLLSLNRSTVALVTILLLLTVTGASAFALRGFFSPTNEFQAFDIPTSQLSTIYSFSLGNSILLPTNNFTVLYHSQTQNDTVANGTLFGSFSSSSATSTVFQENIDLNATKYPYIEVSVTTAPNYTPTSGFAFGLRFVLRLTDGSIIQPLNDQLPIEHVPSGEPATLKVYVPNYTPTYKILSAYVFTQRSALGSNQHTHSILTQLSHQV